MSTVGNLNVKIGADNSDLKSGLKESKSLLGGFGDAFKGALSFAGGMAIFDTIKQGFKQSVGAGMEFNSTMQQNKIAFDSMLGSASKTDKLLGELSKMAANTPFEFPELTTSAKKMLAFGFEAEKIPGMLTKIGDAASGLGLGADGVDRITMALGQMKAKGKISGEELLQLTEAGVPALDILAKAFNTTTGQVQEMASKGVLPVDKALNALVDGMETRFPNMMAKQSKSFKGLMSTLKDNLQMTFGKLMEPLFNNLTDNILPKVIDGVSLFSDAFKETGSVFSAFAVLADQYLGKQFGDIIMGVSDVIDNLKNTFGNMVQMFKDGYKESNDIFASLAAIADQYLGIDFGNAIMSVGNFILNLKNTFMENFNLIKNIVIDAFQNIIMPILNRFMQVVALVMPIVSNIITTVFNAIRPLVLKLYDAFKTYLLPVIFDAFEIVKAVMPGIQSIFNAVFPIVAKIVSNAVDVIIGFIKTAKGIYDAIKPGIDGVVWLFDKVASVIEKAVGWLRKWNDTPAKSVSANMELNSFRGGYATGTTNATSGVHLVGENGPELIKFNGGEQVLNNTDTMRALSGSKQPAVINLYASGKKIAEAIVDDLNVLQGQQTQFAFRGGGLK